jgi:uncharacterized RDD family membrane protein YckC
MLGEHVSLLILGAVPIVLLLPIGGNWGFYLVLVLYLNKDFLNGRSPLKRLLGTQVQHTSGAPATEWQAFWRNTTLLVWPLEVLAVIASGHKRLGDYIAHTQVSDIEKNVSSWQQDLAAYRITPHTFYTLLATAVYLLLVHTLFLWLDFMRPAV